MTPEPFLNLDAMESCDFASLPPPLIQHTSTDTPSKNLLLHVSRSQKTSSAIQTSQLISLKTVERHKQPTAEVDYPKTQFALRFGGAFHRIFLETPEARTKNITTKTNRITNTVHDKLQAQLGKSTNSQQLLLHKACQKN